MEEKKIEKKWEISRFIDRLAEEWIPQIAPEDTEKIYDASKKAIDFFFKHIL
jgi:hypothetical protein